LLFVMIGVMALVAHHGKPDTSVQEIPGAQLVLTLSALTASLLLLGASVLTPVLARVRVRSALGLVSAPAWTYFAAALGAVGLGPIGSLVHGFVKKLAPNLTLGTVDFLNDFAVNHSLWVIWPLLALMPAVCEEVFFRGMLQRALGTTSVAILVSGVAFALFHLDPHHAAAVLPVGLFMAWLAARTGSTFVPIAAHLTNNTLAVAALKLQDGAASDDVPLWMLPPSLVACAVAVAIVLRVTRRKPRATNASDDAVDS
jgi:membrane protease YdiL (CAAX protease family)